jgi:LPS-assembly protein
MSLPARAVFALHGRVARGGFALVAGLAYTLVAGAQPVLPDRGPTLAPPRPAPVTTPPDEAAPIEFEADRLVGVPDGRTEASGQVRLRRGALEVRADRLSYDAANGRVDAQGAVLARQQGNAFAGERFEFDLDSREGSLLSPTYFFDLAGGGGTADRLDLLGEGRARATGATYTSCPIDGSGDPAWLLSMSSVRMDFEANEAIAEGAVLRFQGVPILALPVLSFPLTSARKSGWLPPTINLDTKSGLELAVPFYWNIAPDLDATLTPRLITRRGVGLDGEFRYLLPEHRGIVDLEVLPRDELAGSQRHAAALQHDGVLPGEVDYRALWMRVSDDDYWKDFPRSNTSPTPRLLPTEFALARHFGEATAYARAQRWQVLQSTDLASRIVAPYQRSPQLGIGWQPAAFAGLVAEGEAEFNRFSLPRGQADPGRPTGDRVHAIASISRPWTTPGFRLVPKLAANAAGYRLDADPGAGVGVGDTRWRRRVIPTASLDAIWVLEREAQFFGRASQQTLEPRLLWVRTPFQDQSAFPLFDTAGRDFNFEALFAENAFVGVDRVSDTDQLTAGVTSRVVDSASGAELLRLGVAQRLLARDQQVTPEGAPVTERLSDLLVAGSTGLVPNWQFDAAVQYSPSVGGAVRTVVGLRHFPGPFRTVNMNYRFTRGLTEQVEFGWQWPIAGPGPDTIGRTFSAPALEGLVGARAAAGRDCRPTWYGVGRLNYSLRDSRVTDSILGVEIDSGCWIGRIVAERLSTGRGEATTRLLLQLELVGLSRLGSNPLQVLKDNVPGYRLLRERRASDAASPLAEALTR